MHGVMRHERLVVDFSRKVEPIDCRRNLETWDVIVKNTR